MARRAGTHYVVSAQALDTGAPAYFAAGGEWSPNLQDALPILGEVERDELLARAVKQERLVCDPYFFEVRVEASGIDPLSTRERIRAEGPTTRIRRPDTAGTP